MVTETAITTATAIEAGALEAFNTWLESLGGLRNLLVTIGSSGLLIVLYKAQQVIRWLRSPSFESQLVKLGTTLIDKHSKNPELVKDLTTTLAATEAGKKLLEQARAGKEELLLELEGRRLDVITKIRSGLFEGEELKELQDYLTKLENHLNENTR